MKAKAIQTGRDRLVLNLAISTKAAIMKARADYMTENKVKISQEKFVEEILLIPALKLKVK